MWRSILKYPLNFQLSAYFVANFAICDPFVCLSGNGPVVQLRNRLWVEPEKRFEKIFSQLQVWQQALISSLTSRLRSSRRRSTFLTETRMEPFLRVRSLEQKEAFSLPCADGMRIYLLRVIWWERLFCIGFIASWPSGGARDERSGHSRQRGWFKGTYIL